VSSMWSTPKRVQPCWPGSVSCINGTCVLFSGCLPAALPALRSPARYLRKPAGVACSPAGWHSVAVPPQFICTSWQERDSNQNTCSFIPTFLMDSGQSVIFEWAHLWFLLICCDLAPSAFRCCYGCKHDRSHGRLSLLMSWPGLVFAPALGFCPDCCQKPCASGWRAPERLLNDWANLTLYLLYFLLRLFMSVPARLLACAGQAEMDECLSLAVPCMASVWWLGLSPSMPPSGYSMHFILSRLSWF